MEHRAQNPAPLLVNNLSHLPKGRALDFACGYGRNAFFLAKNTYTVDGFDRNEDAVNFCNDKAQKEALAFTAHYADLEKERPFSDEDFNLITCFYYLDRNIITKLKKALKMGGVILYETFLIDQHRQTGKPSRTEFCWDHNELLHLFSDFRILYYHEGMIDQKGNTIKAKLGADGTWVAQLIAQRIT
ncbi:MAG: methyltransferase domain-containing protein [Nitrospirota bacterium]|nr:methyltransferase domain-containing protein [Nitrospirota bacterium]